jgi:hypothetical protein
LLYQISDMSTKALVLALVGATCVGAAAAGGFVAVRLNSADRSLADAGAPNAPAAAPAPMSDPAPVAVTPPNPPAATPATSASSTSRPVTPSKSPKTAAPKNVAATTAPIVPAPTAATSQTAASDPPSAAAATPPPPPVATPPPPVDPPVTGADAAAPVDPAPTFDEVTVKTDSVIGLSLDNPISSETARVEDRVTAHTTRDVMVDGRVAIPRHSRLEGVVTAVERGGKFKDQARIGIRFTTLYLADNTKFPIQTEPIFRDGDAPGNEAASKVGTGSVLGAILGAVVGGKKGAAIGAAAGAGGGAATVAAGDRNAAMIPSGVPMTVRLTAPVTVIVARDHDRWID